MDIRFKDVAGHVGVGGILTLFALMVSEPILLGLLLGATAGILAEYKDKGGNGLLSTAGGVVGVVLTLFALVVSEPILLGLLLGATAGLLAEYKDKGGNGFLSTGSLIDISGYVTGGVVVGAVSYLV